MAQIVKNDPTGVGESGSIFRWFSLLLNSSGFPKAISYGKAASIIMALLILSGYVRLFLSAVPGAI